jgi:zinc transport system ATP-binding protein
MSGTHAPDVLFDDVSVRYRNLPALENISFSIERGSFWGIIGPNGSGKSTLVKTLLGLVTPWRGTVLTLGVEPWKLGRKRSRIGYVPQYAEMDFSFPIRVIDVVTMGLYGKIGLFRRVKRPHRDRAMRALERAGVADLATRQVSELSGGQRQRVLIARALVLEPDLLILDEPTAALDHGAADGLYAWLHDLHRQDGSTIILVSHDIGVVSQYVDSIACLNRNLVAHGRPADVFNAPTLESMYGCGAMLFDHGHVPHMVVEADDAHAHDHGGGRPH